MDDNQKRDMMDAVAEAIQLLISMDDAGRDRAISGLQHIYRCLERDCKGDQHDPS
jgi:hypothetical protein